MINNKKVSVVMPAYNAQKTLTQTYKELPFDIVDEVILVDDASQDETIKLAKELGIKHVVSHFNNKGYGGNQKTCYKTALELNSDIIIMVHPDYQYTPKLIRAMAALISDEVFDCVLGSRILGTGAIKGGMPKYKYIANRVLTLIQNWMVGHKLSEYHTGYRAFSKNILETLPLEQNSDDFIFDNQMLMQIINFGFSIGEITCPTKYMAEASSIGGWSAYKYGLGVLHESLRFRLHKSLKIPYKIYSDPNG